MDAHERASELAAWLKGRDLNEANTRHQIIDPLLHEVFGWPRSRVSCEEYIAPGFADYVLSRADGTPLLLIESKKEGHFFTLPKAITGASLAAYAPIKTLLTDPQIQAAIQQVRTYCTDVGCEVAAITNGHEWIVFRTFRKGEDWRKLKAFVISSLNYFSDRFTEAHNIFAYTQIVEKGSLQRLLLDSSHFNRQLYYPKERISSFGAQVDSNNYASSLRPVMDKFFGVIPLDDFEFMENCYVSGREYDLAFANARRRLEDALTPYLEQYNIRDFKDGATGGGLARRLQKAILSRGKTDVVVLFGGKGVGKSTFLRKLLFHRPPHILEKNAVVAVADLLNIQHDIASIIQSVWSAVVMALDRARLLHGTRNDLCQLFDDRFVQAQSQDLFGLDPKSEAYNVKLNDLVADWKRDLPYVAACLARYWRDRHKGMIVVIDNTDQFPAPLQDQCFTLAQEISERLGCLSLISMREERFYSSKIHGVLDAFQNSGFHISAPQPHEVFLKRIDFVLSLLTSSDDRVAGTFPVRIDREVCTVLFRIFSQEFSRSSSHLYTFITACSHGNIRFALDLFSGFVLSGYTNVHEMTSTGTWTLQSHQVIKPFMVPGRFFYEEQLSQIPNLFQIRSKVHGSHFTALRILKRLHAGHASLNPPFVPVATLISEIVETMGMREDLELNLDLLLQRGLIEANNRLDEYSPNVDSVRITSYGDFMQNALSKTFTYLELTSADCGYFDSGTANEIAALSNDDYAFFIAYKRMERIEARMKRAEAFISYLCEEENREIDLYKLHDRPTIVPTIQKAFETDRVKVMKSARKNIKQSRTG
jgi:predicted type IV restriction endonuclease